MDLAMIPNLNWLIHMAFVRQDYEYCNEVIEYQFSETYDHEYLYYVKVKNGTHTGLSYLFHVCACVCVCVRRAVEMSWNVEITWASISAAYRYMP